jgi:WD40 repeat protein
MSGPPLKRVEELFHQAVELPPGERPTFLAEACGGDGDLRAAVETLLRHDADAADILGAGPLAREAELARRHAPTLPPQGPGAAPPTLPQLPGYELLRVLGRGGMGVVYLARHTPLNRLVALKTLPSTPATPEQLARFRTEAEALARLQHPHVVPIYDVGEWQGHPYFTMEYVAGPSLADVLGGRPHDAAPSAALVEALARAAHAVHQCGIVHRDIKPANILLVDGGRWTVDGEEGALPSTVHCPLSTLMPKLTDFGLAKDRSAARHLTQSGVALGTPSYMAPEQVRNTRRGVGPAADIYSLGSVLYELLTGRPPFDGATPIETIAQLLNQEPLSPSRLRPRLPADLVTVCLKCLEKSPRRRYASAWDLAEDLRRFRAGEPTLARPVGPVGRAYRWCLRRPLVAGLAALSAGLAVALVVTLLLYNARLADEVHEVRREIVQLNVAIGQEELDEGDAFGAVLHFAEALRRDEDGAHAPAHRRQIAAALRRCPRLLRLWALDGRVVGDNLGLAGGQVVIARADRALEVWDVHTGRTGRGPLPADEEVTDAALSPDGQTLATIATGGTVRVWDVGTGRSRTVPVDQGEAVVRVAFPPGGGTLLTWHAGGAVRLWDLASGEIAPRPDHWEKAAALSDDARWLLTTDGDRKGQVWDLTTGKAAGPPLALEQAVDRAAISADGRRLALVAPDGGVRVWDGTAAKWLHGPAPSQQSAGPVDISPDGERVVTAAGPTIRVSQVAGGEALDIRWRGSVTDVRFSPDGRLVIARNDDGERIWDAVTGRAVTPPLRQGAPFTGAWCGAAGREVVTVGRTGIVCVWQLPPPDEAGGAPSPEEALADSGSVDQILAVARLLAAARIDQEQRREPLDKQALHDAWTALHPGE